MSEQTKNVIEEKLNPNYLEGANEIADLLITLPEPMRKIMVDAMVKYILFQG